jgi:hypothetical protein
MQCVMQTHRARDKLCLADTEGKRCSVSCRHIGQEMQCVVQRHRARDAVCRAET